jgi:hypothetical protein
VDLNFNSEQFIYNMHLRISLALRPIHNTQLQLILPVVGMMGKNQAHIAHLRQRRRVV